MNKITDFNPSLPIYVDLDGTLLNSDMLFESLIACLTKNPLLFFMLPLWFFKGKAFLKHQLALRAQLDISILPYNERVLKYLWNQKQKGSRLILATATDQILANAIAQHLNLFSSVIASDGNINVKNHKKLTYILEDCRGDFCYVGNSSDDLVICQKATEFFLVNASTYTKYKAKNYSGCLFNICSRYSLFESIISILRFHQWIKNLLVFLPLLTSHQWSTLDSLINAIIAFFTFGLSASGIYILNDLADLNSDRKHPYKKYRACASGHLPLSLALIIALALLFISISIAAQLTDGFLLTILLYLILTSIYSLRLKKVLLLDVVLLSILYILRVISGAIVIDVYISFWTVVFCLFIFFSLALIKRCSEITLLSKTDIPGRGYCSEDLPHLRILGISSGLLSVLVLALFIDYQHTKQLYTHPNLLWGLCALLLYWLGYIWLMSGRGCINNDPIVFAITNVPSQIVFILSVVLILLAV